MFSINSYKLKIIFGVQSLYFKSKSAIKFIGALADLFAMALG